MSVNNTAMAARYKNNFLKELEDQAEMGEWIKMCMQCGVCAGSCPTNFHPGWDHPPQEIFMMVRAGKREEVLTSNSMWMCTSCYNCYVRCPRKLPITHIMHGIANYAHRLGVAPKLQPTRNFGKIFWNNAAKTGRVNEVMLTVDLYFRNAEGKFDLMAGIKKALEMQSIALGLVKAGRLNPLELFGGHKCKDQKGIQAMLKKARELEETRKALKAA